MTPMIDDPTFDKRVLTLIADAAGGKARNLTLTPELRLQRDLGIDSIALLGMIVRFETAFGVDLSEVDLGAYAGNIRTVGDVMTYGRDIVRKAAGRPA
jgi:acyl carrier protein